MSVELPESSNDPATKKAYEFVQHSGEEPSPTEWLEVLSETVGIILDVGPYYVDYDGSEVVTVASSGYVDTHFAEGRYIESLLEYYDVEPVPEERFSLE